MSVIVPNCVPYGKAMSTLTLKSIGIKEVSSFL